MRLILFILLACLPAWAIAQTTEPVCDWNAPAAMQALIIDESLMVVQDVKDGQKDELTGYYVLVRTPSGGLGIYKMTRVKGELCFFWGGSSAAGTSEAAPVP